MSDLTVTELRELLDYDSATGAFRWRVRHRRIYIGLAAGRKDRDGYIQIGINGRKYFAHRLAWLHTFGVWPPGQIDHIDRNPSNNRLDNLRPATQTQNQGNAGLPRHNSSGVKGACRNGDRWRAQIKINSKSKYLGTFDSLSEAAAAYEAAALEYFGEFAHPARALKEPG